MKIFSDNKIKMYLGSFLSQIANYLLFVYIIRSMSITEISILAVMDGFLTFLPLLITLVGERTAVIIFFSKNKIAGLALFNQSKVITIFMSVFILILWTPIQYSLNEEHIALSLLIILTSMSNRFI